MDGPSRDIVCTVWLITVDLGLEPGVSCMIGGHEFGGKEGSPSFMHSSGG